jgi:hypothetical protein
MMASDKTVYDAKDMIAKDKIARAKVALLDLHRETKRPDRTAADISSCLAIIQQIDAESEAADVAYIGDHIDEALEHIETALALVVDAEACLALLDTLPT